MLARTADMAALVVELGQDFHSVSCIGLHESVSYFVILFYSEAVMVPKEVIIPLAGVLFRYDYHSP